MKRVCNLIIIFMLVMLVTQFQFNCCFADIIDPDTYIQDAESTSIDDDDDFAKFTRTIIAIIRNVGIVIAVVVILIIGIRTMLASTEEKAVYKEALPGYILGVVMIVATTTLPTVIYYIAQEF